MKIHYYKQFFGSADAPGSQQPITLVRLLAARGHQVSVLSTDYHLDTGLAEDPVEYRSPTGGSLNVFRFPSPRGGHGSLKARLKTYVSFMFTVKREGMKLERPDLIIGRNTCSGVGNSHMKKQIFSRTLNGCGFRSE